MYFFLLGVSHRTAPVDLRERLDFSSRDLGAAVEAVAARPSMAESVVLSTCNRSEIYVASTDPALARDELVSFLSDYHHVPRQTFQPHLPRWRTALRSLTCFAWRPGSISGRRRAPDLGKVKDAFQSGADKRWPWAGAEQTFPWSFGGASACGPKRRWAKARCGEFAAVALAARSSAASRGVTSSWLAPVRSAR